MVDSREEHVMSEFVGVMFLVSIIGGGQIRVVMYQGVRDLYCVTRTSRKWGSKFNELLVVLYYL